MNFPSGDQATELIFAVGSPQVLTNPPFVTSQIRPMPSSLPERTKRPSGDIAIDPAGPFAEFIFVISFPVTVFQILIVPSWPELAKSLPDDENPMELTL